MAGNQDDTCKPGFVSTIILKFSQLNSNLLVKDMKQPECRRHPRFVQKKRNEEKMATAQQADKDTASITGTLQFDGDLNVKDRIKAFQSLSGAFSKAGFTSSSHDATKVATGRFSNAEGSGPVQTISITLEKSAVAKKYLQSVGKKLSKQESLRKKPLLLEGLPQSTGSSNVQDRIRTSSKSDKENVQVPRRSVDYNKNKTASAASKPVWKKPAYSPATVVKTASAVQSFSKPAPPRSVKNVARTFESQSSTSSLSTQSSFSSYKSKPHTPAKSVPPKVTLTPAKTKTPVKSFAPIKEAEPVEPVKFAEPVKPAEPVKVSEPVKAMKPIEEKVTPYTKESVGSDADSSVLSTESDVDDQELDRTQVYSFNASEDDEEQKTVVFNTGSIQEYADDKREYITSSSSSSSITDMLNEFEGSKHKLPKLLIDTTTIDGYYPLPKSYKIDYVNGELRLHLPDVPKKSILKTSNRRNTTKITFSEEPQLLMETYNVNEYERGDDTIEPLTAAAEWEIEKKTDALDKFEVILEKDTKGLGLSIVGIGLGSDVGSEKLGIYIKALTPGGAAEKTELLQVHDQLLEVNGISLVGVTQVFAAQTLKSTQKVIKFLVGREKLPQ